MGMIGLLGRGRSAPPAPEDHATVRRALARLDPWSYAVVALAPGNAGDYAVLGVTGAFVVAVCSAEGRVEPSKRGVSVRGKPIPAVADASRAARRVRGTLLEAQIPLEVMPLVCLTRAVTGGPITIRDVGILGVEDLSPVIAKRPRVRIDPESVRKGAAKLGRVLESASGARPRED